MDSKKYINHNNIEELIAIIQLPNGLIKKETYEDMIAITPSYANNHDLYVNQNKYLVEIGLGGVNYEDSLKVGFLSVVLSEKGVSIEEFDSKICSIINLCYHSNKEKPPSLDELKTEFLNRGYSIFGPCYASVDMDEVKSTGRLPLYEAQKKCWSSLRVKPNNSDY